MEIENTRVADVRFENGGVQRTGQDRHELVGEELDLLLVENDGVKQIPRIVRLREEVEQSPEFVRVVVAQFLAVASGVARRTNHPADLIDAVEVDLREALAVDGRVLDPVEQLHLEVVEVVAECDLIAAAIVVEASFRVRQVQRCADVLSQNLQP